MEAKEVLNWVINEENSLNDKEVKYILDCPLLHVKGFD
jgi:hypothetical protein